MINFKIYRANVSLIVIFLLLLAGCEHEVLLSDKPEVSLADKVQIEIFTRTGSYELPSTKGVNDESTVGMTPWILVFKGSNASAKFVEAVQAFEIAGKRYVLLTKQSSACQLLILANPRTQFYYGDATTGYSFTVAGFESKLIKNVTTLSDACANLRTEPLAASSDAVIPYSGDGETIPMSYLIGVSEISSSTKIENSDGSSLGLVRVVSKIVIVNNASNFNFKGITSFVNVPRQGLLHNNTGAIAGVSGLTELCNTGYSSPLVTATSQSTANKPVYIYESPVSNNTYVIIQGTYEGRDYYYKMAIVNTNQVLLDLGRNKSYTFTIIKARGPGYDTVADAKVSKPSNTDLDYSILIDDSNTYEMMANNDYYLGVSNSIFFAYTNESAIYEAFKLITDCKTVFPNSNSISDDRAASDYAYNVDDPVQIPIAGGSNPDPNITSVKVMVKTHLQYYDEFQYNETGTIQRQNAYVTLKLGNLEKQIHINQRKAIAAGGETIKYMPTSNKNPAVREVNYYCLSGSVEGSATSWIKLRPSVAGDRNDTDNITVDDGVILIEVQNNTTTSKRSGVVYLTTINNQSSSDMTTQRIKIDITQLGLSQN